MDAPKGSRPSNGQARDDSNIRRPPPVQASSQATAEKQKATSVPSPGIFAQAAAGLKEIISPLRSSKGTDSDDSSRYIRQLQDDLRKATVYRQKLDTRHEELRVVYGNATTKEQEACAQAQTLLQEKQGMMDYVKEMQGQLDELAKRCHESERIKQAEEVETHKLRQQLIAFKRSTMVSTKVSGQVTDEDVRSKMDMVFFSIQDFAVDVLRSSQFDDAVADGKAWLEPTRKLIAQIDTGALRKSDQALLDSAIQRVHSMLVDALPMDWTAAEGGLRKIFAAAFELFRTLHSSKALFVVEMLPAVLPHELAAFDPNTMTAINNTTEDEDALGGRSIEVSVFPVVYKFGNEVGENRDEMTIVSKAKVVVQKRPRPISSRK
ncbi:hypothetical protein LTR85_007410 [Meristemomyces frigidus]|nr:hypothetical protein LTR85_007410 [Meristemomyces frigidus]